VTKPPSQRRRHLLGRPVGDGQLNDPPFRLLPDQPVRPAHRDLFAFLASVAVGTLIGGPVGDRIGRKAVIWISIVGVLPFTLVLPYANLFWTGLLTVVIGMTLASASSAIIVYALELVPGRIGMVAGCSSACRSAWPALARRRSAGWPMPSASTPSCEYAWKPGRRAPDERTCPIGPPRRRRPIPPSDRLLHLSSQAQVYAGQAKADQALETRTFLDAMQARLDRMPDAMGIRRQTVEHPFGTIKAWMGSTHFLTRTLKRVSTEMSLHVLAYNIKRVIAILGVGPLLQAIRA
jgi:hypothetical protein